MRTSFTLASLLMCSDRHANSLSWPTGQYGRLLNRVTMRAGIWHVRGLTCKIPGQPHPTRIPNQLFLERAVVVARSSLPSREVRAIVVVENLPHRVFHALPSNSTSPPHRPSTVLEQASTGIEPAGLPPPPRELLHRRRTFPSTAHLPHRSASHTPHTPLGPAPASPAPNTSPHQKWYA